MTGVWERRPIEDLLIEKVRNGVYKPKEFRATGVAMVSMGDLFANSSIRTAGDSVVELSEIELEKFRLQDGDLLFARRSFVLEGAGHCSLVTQPSQPLTFESSIIRARPDSQKADSRYLFYMFRSPVGKALMASIATRTAVSGIRGSDLMRLPVPVPPLSTQRRIASVLSAFDDLIVNNTHRIEILEELARAVYREWFGEFQYPGYEGLPLVDSELGPIPEGWDVSPVKSIVVRRKNGRVYKAAEVLDSGRVPVVDQSRAELLGFHDDEADHPASATSPVAIFGDHTCKMRLMSVPFSLGPNVVAFEARELPIAYLFFAVDGLVETREYKRHWNELMSKLIAVPPVSAADDYAALVAPLLAMIELLGAANRSLRATRDLLLPKLVSGEIDVSDLDLDSVA